MCTISRIAFNRTMAGRWPCATSSSGGIIQRILWATTNLSSRLSPLMFQRSVSSTPSLLLLEKAIIWSLRGSFEAVQAETGLKLTTVQTI